MQTRILSLSHVRSGSTKNAGVFSLITQHMIKVEVLFLFRVCLRRNFTKISLILQKNITRNIWKLEPSNMYKLSKDVLSGPTVKDVLVVARKKGEYDNHSQVTRKQ